MDNSCVKHIVFIRRCPDSLVWGGLEKLALDWFQRIDYSKCRITYVVSVGWKDWFKKEFDKKNLQIDIQEFPIEYKGRSIKKFLLMWRFLCRIKPKKIIFLQGRFISFSFDYVLAGYLATRGNVYMHENLAAEAIPPKIKKRYFKVIPSLNLWWYTEKYGYKLRAHLCKKVLTVGKELKERLVDLWGYPEGKIQIRYHGIETKKFLPDPIVFKNMRDKNHISDTDTVIISTARMSQEKALYRIIKAFDDLSASYKNLQLVLLGSGPLEENLKQLAQECRNAECIRFVGHQDNVTDWLKMSDIYVLSSDNEGFSLAVLEAMCAGLICVTAKCPGTKEIIEDGINGFLAEKNTKGIIFGLKRALSLTSEERKCISQKAAEHIFHNFEINDRVKDTFEVMDIPFTPIHSGAVMDGVK